MGAMMPLPERVPCPDEQQRDDLESMGFIVGNEDNTYVTLTLPEGMEWRSIGHREDFPDWHVVSKEEKAFVHVSGSWKGTYDNHLNLRVTPEGVKGKFASTRETEEFSETSGPMVLAKLVDVLNPHSDACVDARHAHEKEIALKEKEVARMEAAEAVDPDDADAVFTE